MGRTNPTYREFLRRYRERCAPYRRGLRRGWQADFDRLFERAERHAAAAGQLNATDPEPVVLLSMLLSHERELRQLREAVDAVGDGGDKESVGADGGDERVGGRPE
ncbi:hypothetical protein [Natronorarus salvus]|uniref:hypothetical protein n=1 Tax=Natronorarus salvus TaxID=3117733 RepID=UPI002F25FE92